MKKLNGWFSKYTPWFISTTCIILSLVITVTVAATQLQEKANRNEQRIERCEVKNDKQDDCLTNIQISLGRIEGKLDSALDGGD